MADLLTAPITQIIDSTGAPLAGGKVYTYVTGSSLTPKDAYTDSSGTTPLLNPVILDSNGAAEIWLSGGYRIVIRTAADVLLYDVDDVNLGTSSSASFTDSAFEIVNNSDATKKVKFSASSLTTATTRTYTWPDKSGTVAMTSDITTNVIYSHIAGFLPTSQTFTSSTIASMTITAGQATDSTNASMLAGSSFSWNISNGNAGNGYQGGTTLPNSSTIHFYVMATASDTSWTSSFASLSLTPTLPGSYTKYRRVFSLRTSGAGALLPATMIEAEGGSVVSWLATATLDISTTTLGTSRTAYALNVPTGIKVHPILRFNMTFISASIILTSGDETDIAPPTYGTSFTTAPGFDVIPANNNPVANTYLTTDTSGQIGARATTTSVSLYAVTRGWKDFRR
jgi:hypothetical protein